MKPKVVRSDIWRLAIHYYPNAAVAQVRPYPCPWIDPLTPAFSGAYIPKDFCFQQPPSLSDFMTACKTMPWTLVWEDTIFPLLQACSWPVICPGFKAARTDLINNQGQKVGHISVTRDTIFAINS